MTNGQKCGAQRPLLLTMSFCVQPLQSCSLSLKMLSTNFFFGWMIRNSVVCIKRIFVKHFVFRLQTQIKRVFDAHNSNWNHQSFWIQTKRKKNYLENIGRKDLYKKRESNKLSIRIQKEIIKNGKSVWLNLWY